MGTMPTFSLPGAAPESIIAAAKIKTSIAPLSTGSPGRPGTLEETKTYPAFYFRNCSLVGQHFEGWKRDMSNVSDDRSCGKWERTNQPVKPEVPKSPAFPPNLRAHRLPCSSRRFAKTPAHVTLLHYSSSSKKGYSPTCVLLAITSCPPDCQK
ncbi:hypothetical protein B0T16DRAFT_189780 [Cercophora newfieldiana]|uniref:Uncharacterized protein n=1 Tax=Cercophora newfieldiana TaxID=92897 RepID=A0AA39Y3I4_9PEZI|nr:hypothetical protein B0T16DRAFT_189780 [Cercophora newfieldiana]